MPTTGLTPDFVVAFVILDLTLILAAALLVGALFRKLGQPTVVGEIVAGILLGPTLLGPTIYTWTRPWTALHCSAALAGTQLSPSITNCVFPPQSRAVLNIIGQVALILFMFLVGLGLNLTQLKGRGRGIATVSLGATLIPVGLGLLIAPALYNSKFVAGFGSAAQPSRLAFALVIGAMLAVTALPVMAHILQEKGLSSSRIGAVGIAASAVISVLMFLVLTTALSVDTHAGAGKIVGKYAITAIYIAIMFLVVRPALKVLGRRIEKAGTMTPPIMGWIFVVVLASSYVSNRIGLTVIPGAFIAGVILPAREILHREVSLRLRDFTLVILLPVFLAYSGLNTDFTQLRIAFLGGIVLFLVAGVVGKWGGGALSARIGGLSWHEGNALGILMNCRGLLVLVVALAALNAKIITGPLQVGAVLMALITTMMTAPLFDRFNPSLDSEASMSDSEPRMQGVDDSRSLSNPP
jgi:Kef-type K+ transport system membrane component KefB